MRNTFTIKEIEKFNNRIAKMNILEYIEYLIDEEGYTEENANICADEKFRLKDDYEDYNYINIERYNND